MISFLMPSRSRVHLARESIQSLGKSNFEVLIAVDEDDPQLQDYYELKSNRVRIFVTPRYGYEFLHEYYNLLAKKSKGDWLFLWNDDATMLTPDYYERICELDHTKPIVIDPWQGQGNLFPVLSRKYYEIIGHYSLNAHADSWPENVAVMANVQIPVPLDIRHLGEALYDEVHKESRGVLQRTKSSFYSEVMVQVRQQESEKISNYLKGLHGSKKL
jgi:hypothetical protein